MAPAFVRLFCVFDPYWCECRILGFDGAQQCFCNPEWSADITCDLCTAVQLDWNHIWERRRQHDVQFAEPGWAGGCAERAISKSAHLYLFWWELDVAWRDGRWRE